MSEYPDKKMHEKKTEKESYDRRKEKTQKDLDDSFGDDDPGPRCRDRCAHKTRQNGMTGGCRKSEIPGDEVLYDGGKECRDDRYLSDRCCLNQSGSHHFCNCSSRECSGDIQDRGHGHGDLGREDPCRYRCGYGICSVMETVNEIEDKARTITQTRRVNVSCIFQDDRFNDVCHVFALVRGVLEVLIDLFPLDDQDRVLDYVE